MLYATLKRRSSTVLSAFTSFFRNLCNSCPFKSPLLSPGEYAVDSSEFVGREAQVSKGRDILRNLFDPACADQSAGHAGISQNPGESHLSDGLPA
jgi:hypothetical protein